VRVSKIALAEDVLVDIKTTHEWDKLHFKKRNQKPDLDEEGDVKPLKGYGIVTKRSRYTDCGIISDDKKNPKHPLTRIVPREIVSVPLHDICVIAQELVESDTGERPSRRKYTGLHLAAD